MSLKCSVLGHSFGETEVERDREEQGSEVVITIREVETCERCGTERTVSENKEVTAIETPDDGVVGGSVDDASEPADATAAPDEGDASEADPDEAPVDEPSDGDGAAEIVDAEPAGGTGADGDEEPAVAGDAAAEADGDDAVPDVGPDEDGPDGASDVAEAPVDADQGAEIIDAEADEPVDDELADPSVGEPELEESEPEPEPEPDEADDAVFIDEADDEGDGDDRAPGEWPDEDDGDDGSGEEWSPDVGAEQPAEGPEIRKSSGVSVTVPEGQFRCPECGHTTPVESSSLRAGDFCPECHRGTLINEPAAEDGTRKE
ncbi:DUF7093 family protein [Halomicrobium salinisoli]|uniref:DUF7093 family protein n=1 Tax=Halomicrobium salinisoli TaxID=2878391 RepID=UPI001CF0ACF3|nr:hypothetical protein [Halomicrobium salinisoli]